MTSIKLLNNLTKSTIDGFVMPKCQLVGCNCDIRFSYPTGARADIHSRVDDTLTIGTIAQCNAGIKDIVQSVADGLVSLKWAKVI